MRQIYRVSAWLVNSERIRSTLSTNNPATRHLLRVLRCPLRALRDPRMPRLHIHQRILKRQLHARHPHRLAARAPREDHVDHLRPAQALAAAFTQDPLDSVDNIALAAAVGTNNARDRMIKRKFDIVRKALEALHRQLRQAHALAFVR